MYRLFRTNTNQPSKLCVKSHHKYHKCSMDHCLFAWMWSPWVFTNSVIISDCLIKEDKFSLETTLVPHEAKRCGAAGINGIRWEKRLHNPEVSRHLATANKRPKVGQLTNERAALVSGQCQAEKTRPEMSSVRGAGWCCILTADTRMWTLGSQEETQMHWSAILWPEIDFKYSNIRTGWKIKLRERKGKRQCCRESDWREASWIGGGILIASWFTNWMSLSMDWKTNFRHWW